MTKKYCDICGTEITGDSQFGILITSVKVPVFDPKTKVAGMSVKEVLTELCEECLKQVSEALNNIKK